MKIDLNKLHTLNEAEIEEILYRHGKKDRGTAFIALCVMTFYGIVIGLFLGWWAWG